MKDLYNILGVEKSASIEHIKKTYRKLALSNHPDKGGDGEIFKLINEAYQTLSDVSEREKYDKDWEISNFSLENEDHDVLISGFLNTAGIHFSNTFRNQHESLTAQFRSSPLQEGDPSAQIKSFHTDLYSLGDISCSDIFSFIKMKTRGNPYHSVPLIDANSLTLEAAVDVFVKFLRGEYYGKSLRDLVRKFNIAIDNIAQNEVVRGHIQPLEGIRQIILMADNDTYQDDQLLNAILKITDYAKENVDQSIRYFAPLFQNKYFRNLYSQALHQYWLSGKSILDDDFLEKFNGHDKSAGYIDKIKEIMLKNREAGQSNDHLAGILRYVRLLNRLDKDINSDSGRDDTSLADFYRKKAYLILDWIPAIASTSGQSIIINTLLQAGVLFQKASSLEKVAAVRMADEKIALYVYLNAHKIGLRSTPDVEFYIYAHCLKFLSCARYVSPDLEDVFSAFQHRSLVIADIYPFFLTAQSNIDFQAQEDKSIILMRGLLHELNRIISINTSMAEEKDERPRVAIDHDYVKIFNQAYEACLKHWYEKKYNPETEKAFRIKLMQELLAVNRWTFLDLEFNLSAPWIMIKRDDQGWISPSRVLPFPDRVLPNNFSSIDGIEFDSNTGQIEFVFKKWKRGDATYKNLISIMDLSELFETKMSSAFFSLDPVDPDMPHHPFNKMRFGPPSVCQTQLFHTMLLTDYLLKFMTVGQEVQGQFPYGMKPIDDLTKNLPEYLKKIITDFHSSNHSEAMHRFWIEAQETVPVAVADEKLESTGISRYAVDDIKMVVKKHAMVYDINGNLVDKNEDDEGWGLYVLTESEKREFDLGRRVIEGPAIIFIMETNNLYFFDEDKLSNVFYLNYCDHHLYRLFNYPRNKDQRVILTQDSSHTIYRVTREAAKQSGRDHHYSPEYVFAREFTLHYNEFAMYFPEFGRLRELSKAMVLVGIMNRHREVNNHEIDRLNDLLKGNSDWKKIEQEIKTSVGDNLRREFSTWRDKFSKYKITKSCEESLNDVRRQVGSLTFSSSSPEISKIKNDWYEENKQSIISKHGYAAWNANSSKIWSDINSEVPSLIKKLSDQKYDNWRSELLRHFRDELAGYYNPQYLVECFLDGNDSPLLNELVKHNEGMIHKQIQKNFPKCSVSTIDSALNGSPQAINQIIDQMVKEEIERQKGVISAKISERLLLEKSFNKLGFGEVVDDPNLENICWWVPASISHDVEKGSSRFVYGGVRIAPQASFMQPNNPNGQMLLNQTFNGQNQGRVGSSDFGSAGGAGRQTLDHSAIKFSQSSVNGAQEITSSMRQNGWQGAPIDVVRMRDGSLIALDNTRVLAASRAGIKVEANVHNSNSRLSEDFSRRFSTVNGGTPKTWGEAVANRINKQSATYRNTYPMGSNIIGAKK